MHHIYHTEGIILGSRNLRESDKYYFIFTRDLGMIYASASGVRKMSSKLRYVLQDFAYIKVDLVQGRNTFRITSASKTNLLDGITKRPETLRIVSSVARLLKRLLAGVEPNEVLFADLIHSFSVLEKVENKNDFQNIEVVMVLRILNNLGYIGENEILQNLVRSPFDETIIFEASQARSHVLKHINDALKETHL